MSARTAGFLGLLLLPAAALAQNAPAVLRAAGRGAPWLNLRDGQPVHAEYSGDAGAAGALRFGQAQPLSLASADFDEDGVPDLIAGYAVGTSGAVALDRGNIDALWPYGKVDPPAFLPDVRVFPLPEAPDFLGVGDFDADGHWDIVAARRGGNALWLLRGDGHGGFGEAQRLPLDGAVTAFATGEINRPDGLIDFAVAIAGTNGARVLVFESPLGAWRATPEVFELNAPASDLAMARLEHGPRSLVIAAGHDILIVHGRDRRLTLDPARRSAVPPAVVTRQSFPFEVRSFALGNYTTGKMAELAALGDDRKVHIVGYSAGAFQPINAHVAMRPGQLPFTVGVPAVPRRAAAPGAGPDWESHGELALPGGDKLVAGHVSAAGIGDLIVLDRASNRLHIVEQGVRVAASFDSPGAPAAVFPMRLNQHPLDSLVTLAANVTQPLVAAANPANTFTVTTTADSGAGSLRQAILDANQASGASSIVFNIPTTDPNYNPANGQFTIYPQPQNPGAACQGTPPDGIGGSIALPVITSVTTVDGYTQPGASPNNLANGDDAVILININGSQDTTTGGIGLVPSSNGFTVRGFHIFDWTNPCDYASASAINPEGTAGFIEGNILGIDSDDLALEGSDTGIYDQCGQIIGQIQGCVIGGTAPQARNLITGNGAGYLADFLAGPTMIAGNYIGTDRGGAYGLSIQVAGVTLAGIDSVLGGVAAQSANLISGNEFENVFAFNESGEQLNLIQGNLIGTDYTGARAVALPLPGDGIWLSASNSLAASGDTVGGTTPAARNIISGNTSAGVAVDDVGQDNIIEGNYIGTDITGSFAIPNTNDGVSLGLIPTFASLVSKLETTYPASNTTIGGAVPGAGNLISGNAVNGVEIDGLSDNGGEVPEILIEGNLIGTDATGTKAIGNGGAGVLLGPSTYNTTVGGATPPAGNTIAFNSKQGVLLNPGSVTSFYDGENTYYQGEDMPVLGNAIFSNGGDGVEIASGIQNPLSRNSIYGNGGLEIDLGSGVANINSNCQSAASTGGNGGTNAPVLNSGSGSTFISATATDENGNTSQFSNCATVSGTSFTATGTYNGVANKPYTIEFFQSSACDPSNYGPGQTFVGSTIVTTGSNCTASINQSLNVADADMSITLTDPNPPYAGSTGLATLSSTVTNNGGATATNVMVNDTLPATWSLVSVTSTFGTCSISGNAFTCSLGTVVSGTSATIGVSYTPLNATKATDTITVSATQPDSNPANNTVSLTLTPQDLFPGIDQLDPPSVVAGSGALTLSLYGSGYIPNITTVTFNGTQVPVQSVSTITGTGSNFSNTGCYRGETICQRMTVLVAASLLTTAGTVTVVATNPAPSGGSDNISFHILASCMYNVSPTSVAPVAGSGGDLDFAVTPNPSTCTWSAASSVPWIVAATPGDFTGAGSPEFYVQSNGGAARSGSVTVGGQIIPVMQDAGTCGLTLTAISEAYTARGGTGEFTIVEDPLECSNPAATSDSSWLTFTAAPFSQNNVLIYYSVAANTSTAPRTGHITVPGAGSFTVTQLGSPGPCDVLQFGATTVQDVQQMIGEALGALPPDNDLQGGGAIHVAGVQMVLNAARGGACQAP